MSKQEITFTEIELDDAEAYIGTEIYITLMSGQSYSGLLKDIDDDELILNEPDLKFGLAFKTFWIRNIYVKED